MILGETPAVYRGNQTDRTYSVSRIQGLGPQRSPRPILSAFFPTEYSITVESFDCIDTEIRTELTAQAVQRVWTVRGSNPDVDKTSVQTGPRPPKLVYKVYRISSPGESGGSLALAIPFSVEVKNQWSYTSTPIRLHGMLQKDLMKETRKSKLLNRLYQI